MISWHRAGQKVVCIAKVCDAHRRDWNTYPEPGRVYTIRDVVVMLGDVAFRLAEVVNKEQATMLDDGRPFRAEPCFDAVDFRPVYPDAVRDLEALLVSPEVRAGRLEDA